MGLDFGLNGLQVLLRAGRGFDAAKRRRDVKDAGAFERKVGGDESRNHQK